MCECTFTFYISFQFLTGPLRTEEAVSDKGCVGGKTADDSLAIDEGGAYKCVLQAPFALKCGVDADCVTFRVIS